MEPEISDVSSRDEDAGLVILSHPRRSYAFLLVSNFLWFFGLGLYSNFLSLFLTGIGASPIDAGLFSSLMMASGILWTGLGGVLTTRFGVKPLLIIGWLIVIPAPIFYIFAQSLGWHLALIGAFFEGSALLAVAPFRTYTSLVTTQKQRGFGYSLIASSSAIAGIPAPTVGGLLIAWFGYNNLFILVTIIYVISTVMLIPLTTAQRTQDTQNRQWRGDFLSNRTFILATLFMGVVFSIVTLADFFVPLFLNIKFGFTEAQIGVLFTILSASGALFGPLLGVAGDRWGHVKVLTFPIIGLMSYYLLLILLPLSIMLPLAYIVRGLAFGTYILTNAIISQKIHPTQLPNAFAVHVLASRAITPFTPYLGGIAYTVHPVFPLLTSGLILPINFVILFLLHRSQQSEGSKRPPLKASPS
ncbi:MAG: MFS transporter [Candidatus Hodarchaeota archaeon]